jgi:hypothetical protein
MRKARRRWPAGLLPFVLALLVAPPAFAAEEIGLQAEGTPWRGSSPFAEVEGTIDGHNHVTAYEFLGGDAHCGEQVSGQRTYDVNLRARVYADVGAGGGRARPKLPDGAAPARRGPKPLRSEAAAPSPGARSAAPASAWARPWSPSTPRAGPLGSGFAELALELLGEGRELRQLDLQALRDPPHVAPGRVDPARLDVGDPGRVDFGPVTERLLAQLTFGAEGADGLPEADLGVVAARHLAQGIDRPPPGP